MEAGQRVGEDMTYLEALISFKKENNDESHRSKDVLPRFSSKLEEGYEPGTGNNNHRIILVKITAKNIEKENNSRFGLDCPGPE